MLFLKWVVTFNSKVLTQAQWSSEMDLLRISKKSEKLSSLFKQKCLKYVIHHGGE